MMDTATLIESFADFAKQKNIDRPTMIRILEDVFRNMIRKKYITDDNFDIIVNADKGDLEIWRFREIVDDGEYLGCGTRRDPEVVDPVLAGPAIPLCNVECDRTRRSFQLIGEVLVLCLQRSGNRAKLVVDLNGYVVGVEGHVVSLSRPERPLVSLFLSGDESLPLRPLCQS